MEPKDWLAAGALVVSFTSLAVAVVALRRTSAHNVAMRRFASAGPDIALAGQINQAWQTIANIDARMAEVTRGKPPDKLTAKERQQLRGIGPIYQQAVEALHSCYNLACLLYLNGGVDRDRFRGQYERDLRELFEEGAAADRELLASVATPYKALRAVYIEWFGRGS